MVNSINSVNGATVTTATQAVSKTEKTEETAKKEEQTKKTEEKKLNDVEKEETNTYAFDKETLKVKIKEYIENLKKKHDNPIISSELDSYLSLLNIDNFMKMYPNIKTDADFNSIMYNETLKYL